jgi:hypothetical protein
VLDRLDREGCARYVVTDVNKDGMLQGPNVELLRSVCARTDAPVVASGGISTLDDLRVLARLTDLASRGDHRHRPLHGGIQTRGRDLGGGRGAHVSLAVRVIPCLDVPAGRVVKGVGSRTCVTPATRSRWRRSTTAPGPTS